MSLNSFFGFYRLRFGLSFFLCFVGAAVASPSDSRVASAAQVDQRAAETSFFDFSRRVGAGPWGTLLTEPLLNALWVEGLMTGKDWMAVKSLAALAARIDPGGKDDASNMFVYTCRGGWIDVGHVICSALAYKAMQLAVNGASLVRFLVPKLFKKHDAVTRQTVKGLSWEAQFFQESMRSLDQQRAPERLTPATQVFLHELCTRLSHPNSPPLPSRVSAGIRQICREFADGNRKFLPPSYQWFFTRAGEKYFGDLKSFWAGYWAMRVGYAVEDLQTNKKVIKRGSSWTGYETSAYTLEDLPSDFYGVQMAPRTGQRYRMKDNLADFRKELQDLLKRLEVVDPARPVSAKRVKLTDGSSFICPGPTAGDVMRADAKFYAALAEKTHLPQKISSFDPMSVYNESVKAKPSRLHECLCRERWSFFGPSIYPFLDSLFD